MSVPYPGQNRYCVRAVPIRVRNSVRIEVGRHLHDDPSELHGGRLVGFHLIFEKITELLQPRDLMRGYLEAAGAGVEPATAAVTFHAADPTGPDGDVMLPSAILSAGGGVILPGWEIALFAGSGGSGKSRLSLQVAVAAASVPAGTAEPIPDGTLRVASGPVVMLGYEDAAPWIAWRARRLARWLDDRTGTTHHARAVTDHERLSVAAVDAPLFGVTLGAGREAIPGPLASWRPLWDHAAAIGARLVIIDPVALAGQWDGYSALPVGVHCGDPARAAGAHRPMRRVARVPYHEGGAVRRAGCRPDRGRSDYGIGRVGRSRARGAHARRDTERRRPQAAIRCEGELRGPTDSLRRAIRE